MSEDYLAQQQPTLNWNTARGVWEKQGMVNLLCEHSELFSETWQTSGMMRNGQVFELPTQAHLTTASEFSSSPILRTPAAREAERGHQPEDKARARGGQVTLSGQMMSYFPTPNTMDHLPARTPEQKAANKGKGGYANVRETVVNDLLPTTRAQNNEDRNNKIYARDPKQPQNLENALAMLPTPVASEGTKASATQSSSRRAETGQVFLTNIIHDVAVENGKPVPQGNQLLPTPTAVDGNTVAKSELDNDDPKHRLKVAAQVLARDGIAWGKFEPAIRRWEETLGRPAPSPTKPDGKDGNHRLSSAFTEWMMGLPGGWITDVGLSRNDELKACGNGVVPQQAELALRVLLEGVNYKEDSPR